MHINFAMWRKASWQLIKMDDKKEWDSLDVVSKWLIATRSAVTLVTVYSCVIAGLLAWRDGNFSWIPFLILTLGLFIAHGTNNILNDYTDYSRGLDKDNYFRRQYGVHPTCTGFLHQASADQVVPRQWGAGSPGRHLCFADHQFQPNGDWFVCLWRDCTPRLYLSIQILGTRRVSHFPDLGTHYGRRGLPCYGVDQRRRYKQPLECCPCGYSLWLWVLPVST